MVHIILLDYFDEVENCFTPMRKDELSKEYTKGLDLRKLIKTHEDMSYNYYIINHKMWKDVVFRRFKK